MNFVAFSGNVGDTPQVRQAAGKQVVNFSIAVSYGPNFSKTQWFRVTTWERLSEKAKNVAKGDHVTVCGRLEVQEWEAKDGTKRTTLNIIATDFGVAPKAQVQREQIDDFLEAPFDPGFDSSEPLPF